MNRKQIFIIGGAVVIVILIAATGGIYYYFNVLNKNVAGANTTNQAFSQGNGGGRFSGGPGGAGANFATANGKVLSADASQIIIDDTSGQSIVTWDDQTQIRKNVVSDRATIITVRNNVMVRYTDDGSGNFTASSVTLFDPTLFPTPQGGFSGNVSGTPRPSGGFRGGNGANGGGRVFPTRSGNATRNVSGKVTAVDGNKLTIVLGDGNTNNSFDISAATFNITQKAAITDVTVGTTIQVIGTKNSTGILARTISIQ